MTRRRDRAVPEFLASRAPMVWMASMACLALAVTGCTAPSASPGAAAHGDTHGAPASNAVTPATLTAFHSCPQALAALRKATEASVTPSGLPTGGAYSGNVALGVEYAGPVAGPAAGPAAAPAAAAGAAGAAANGTALPEAASASAGATPAYSGTNDYTAGVDEPDIVKTDGLRIVTIEGNTLEVIDAATRRVTGTLNLAAAGISGGAANLLLSGDHALVLASYARLAPSAGDQFPPGLSGPGFLLVDLTGKPRVLASYTIDGNLVDARQVGSVVRIVIGSSPEIVYPDLPASIGNAGRVAQYRAITSRAGLNAWLPRYDSRGATRIEGQVPCTAVSRPRHFSGTNLLTVLSFNLSGDSFGTGDPVSVAADGDTVYGTTSSLYVASAAVEGFATPYGVANDYLPGYSVAQGTQIYRFDITAPGAPRFVASGSVPGYLVNQYSMSEWNGYLRIATTTGTSWAEADGKPTGARTSSSAVYVLTTSGPTMRMVGQVTGLGSTERIYAVRFMGPVGYVVTFRQTDPLYTLDLSDPSRPRVVGALGLTGYSSYLDPVSATRLIGVGQQADSMGHMLGTQISLFDVSDLAAPARLATYELASSTSLAQVDPHAFLYWPASSLVVVPLEGSGLIGGPVGGAAGGAAGMPTDGVLAGALVLRITGSKITVAGFIRQSQAVPSESVIERSLVIGQTLWTVSPSGLMASDLTTLRQQAWLPFPAASNGFPERSPVPPIAP